MRLRRALDEFIVDGIETTLPLFRTLVRNADVQNGQYDIHWLEEFLKTDPESDAVRNGAAGAGSTRFAEPCQRGLRVAVGGIDRHGALVGFDRLGAVVRVSRKPGRGLPRLPSCCR